MVRRVARYFRVTHQRVSQMVREGKLPTRRLDLKGTETPIRVSHLHLPNHRRKTLRREARLWGIPSHVGFGVGKKQPWHLVLGLESVPRPKPYLGQPSGKPTASRETTGRAPHPNI
jgi:hypothetical protein